MGNVHYFRMTYKRVQSTIVFVIIIKPIDICHAVTILVMFPVSITVMNANIHCANMAPDYFSSILNLVTMSWNGVKCPHREKGLY